MKNSKKLQRKIARDIEAAIFDAALDVMYGGKAMREYEEHRARTSVYRLPEPSLRGCGIINWNITA